MGALRTGFWYFLAVFALGFVLGTVRVLWLAPAIGEIAAVCAELPVMLAFSWFVCARLTVGRPDLNGIAPRLLMGGSAFVLLMAAEAALATLVFGKPPIAYVASLLSPAGEIGLAGQGVFALIPWLQRPRGGRRT